ncbi:MAG: hypothetical protein V3S37_05760 [Dehalococcoidia bacterium]
MAVACLLPSGQEAVQTAGDGLVIIAPALLQLQDTWEGLGMVSAKACRRTLPLGRTGFLTSGRDG